MTTSTSVKQMPADWTRTLTDEGAFRAEQSRLRYKWTFLGLAQDVAVDGDWFRASLATRSIFVQRFGEELRGFENRCAHRFFPLRTADKGNGPVVCGFHHWRYDKTGRAMGVPLCEELFGKIPRDLGATLTPVEVATCGDFIFGRFEQTGDTESLAQFLGDLFPVLEAVSRAPVKPYATLTPVRANWRLCYHITHDDYHQVAVHPSTFGKGGYPRREAMSYSRTGLHSAFLSSPDPTAINKLAEGCRDGTFRSSHYFILQIFPNMIVSHGRSDAQFWHILVQQYSPVAHDRSLLRTWSYPSPFPANHKAHVRWTRPFTDPFRTLAVRHVIGKIRGEDHAVCERVQTIAGQINKAPMLGALEERIGWFEENYARAMAGNTD